MTYVYGLFIWAPPRRAKDYVYMLCDEANHHIAELGGWQDWNYNGLLNIWSNEDDLEKYFSPIIETYNWCKLGRVTDDLDPLYKAKHVQASSKKVDSVEFRNYKTKRHYGVQEWKKSNNDPEIKPQFWECLEMLLEIREQLVRIGDVKLVPSFLDSTHQQPVIVGQSKESLCDKKWYSVNQKDNFPEYIPDMPDEEHPTRHRKLFIETNLGNRLKKWSAKHLFDGDMSKATTINDLRHLYINDFYKTPRTDEERLRLSKLMGHNIRTQSYYKKDNNS